MTISLRQVDIGRVNVLDKEGKVTTNQKNTIDSKKQKNKKRRQA